MPDLRLDGRAVKTSFLTQRSYRAASCDLLLEVTPGNRDRAIAELKRAGELGVYSGLSVTGIADLSFLEQFPLLLYLEVSGAAKVSPRDLQCLENLRGLSLETPGGGIDFAWFPELEVYVGGWHPAHRNLSRCQELRRLQIRGFNPKTRDLSPLAGITRLEMLQITQTNIESLAGLETLEDLRYLDVAYAPKLEALEPLPSGGEGLRELSFSNAKKIRSYEPLGSLGRLRRLKLTACTPMASLAWTAGMDRLDFFSFVETDVADGDLSPLLKLPMLRYAGTLDRKHYNPRCDALNAILAARGSEAPGAE